MCDCQAFFCCLCVLIVLGLGAGLGYYFLKPEDFDLADIEWPTLEDFLNEEPFNATGPDDGPRWENDGNGLQLEILNALDSEWYSYFDIAVADWNNGNPPVLNLTTRIVDVDTECSPVVGKLKVCNGNYGSTGWRGINNAIFYNNIIESSVAKMNEYYLNHETNARKQYTMCHEIGHGT